MRLEDLKDGRVIAGDWECDGTDPFSAVRLYKAAEEFVDKHGLVAMISIGPGDEPMLPFYLNTGWSIRYLVLFRDKDSEKGFTLDAQNTTVQSDR